METAAARTFIFLLGRTWLWPALPALLAAVLTLQPEEHEPAFSPASRFAISTPPGVKPIRAPGLHNLFALSANVLSGSSPESEEAFAALKQLGVRTIISVDGAQPGIESARRNGIRYVHLPHSYDGISAHLQLRLVQAAETLPGPIYVHCHHGKHRGPAAAAILCMATEGWSSEEAEAWLVTAGTATNYSGLYDVVRAFRKPSADTMRSVPAEFPERAEVSDLVDAMVGIDNQWELLRRVWTAGFQSPKEHPGIKPDNEAVILWEHYREAQRLPEAAHHGTDFIDRLKAAETEAQEAERLLQRFAAAPKAETRERLDRTFEAMEKRCSSCHQAYRGAPASKPGAIKPLD